MSSQPDNSAAGLWKRGDWAIYNNALPIRPRRVDIARLEGDFAYILMENLLKGRPFEMAVDPPFPVAQALQSAYFEARASERVRGYQPFGLGFPIVLGRDEQGGAIAAPLFIWSLNIEPSLRQVGRWTLSRRQFQKVEFNRFLLAYWDITAGTELTAHFEKALAGGRIDAALLARLCRDAGERMSLENASESIALTDTPGVEELDRYAGQPRIHWAGVLGLYPPCRQLFAPGAEAVEEEDGAPPAHALGMLPLDPFQAAAAAAVFSNGATLAAGLPGSGRVHLAVHLLSNALSNGQHCLVVAPRLPSLRAIQQRLEQLGLGRLSFLLRDIHQDLPLFAEIIRAAANTKEPELAYPREDYRRLAARAERLKSKLDKSYLATRSPAFGNHNWTETVGLYLQSIRKEGKETLSTQLNAQDYQFSYEEYEQLSQAIASCRRLLKEEDVLRSPLNRLHPGIFLHMSREEAQPFIEEKTEALLSRAVSLRHWYISRVNTYSEMLSAHYEQYYQDNARRLSRLNDRIAECFGRFGEAFAASGMGGLRLKSAFSGKAGEMLATRQEIAAAYEKLRVDFEDNAYFEYAFPPADNGRDIPVVQEGLNGFEQALARWRSGLREAVHDEILRLSHKTAHPRLGFSERVAELEEGLEHLLEQANESGLYHLPVSHKSLTIPKRQRFLDEFIEQLEITRRSLEGFDAFYDWQHNWLQLNEGARRLVKALIKGRPQDWQSAFESWFLDNCLSLRYQAVLPPEHANLRELAETIEAFRPLLLPQILLSWHRRKEEGLRQLRRQSRAAYQMATGKQQEQGPLALKEHFRAGLEAISSMMPALLATPQVAAELFAGAGRRFGLVIVADASLLSREEVKMLRGLARRIVFLGNALPEGAAPAAYSFLGQSGVGRSMLYQGHRHFPGNLLQYQNAGILQEGPEALRFEQLDGRYDEQAETNEEEALHIIGLLNKVEKTPQRTYPSVGIVCLSKGQRDLISSYLLHIKQRRSTGVEAIQQLERNGLAVLHISELCGQRFDTLVISGTFGVIDLRGSMTGHIHSLGKEGALESMFTLMCTAEKRVHVVNSIPLTVLDELSAAPHAREGFLLASYFKYLKAASEQDRETATRIVEGLPGWMHFRSPYGQPRPFLEEVARHLQPYLGPGRVQLGEGPAPLKIQAAGPQQQSMYVAPDGFLAQGPATDYRWEYEQAVALEARGYRPVRAWSADWWRNPELEAKRMASLIIRQERQLQEEEE